MWKEWQNFANMNTTTLQLKHSINRSSGLLVLLALACFSLSPTARAVTPPPDVCLLNFNARAGCHALYDLTTGVGNSAMGWHALAESSDASFSTGFGAGALSNNNGDSNTAVGAAALLLNTTGTENVAIGTDALLFNDGGSSNTANGAFALSSNTEGIGNTAIGLNTLSNTTGSYNTAVGIAALEANTTPNDNTAIGNGALVNNTTGGTLSGSGQDALGPNTAVGSGALSANITGNSNAAVGFQALQGVDGNFNTAVGFRALYVSTASSNDAFGYEALWSNTEGFDNTALGQLALFNNTTGTDNVAVGNEAGMNQDSGSGNVYIGSGIQGIAGESNACYIKSIFGQTSVNGVPVLINSDNKLGTTTSSVRFKEAIKPMDKASEAILALKPVTFHYKKELDPQGTQQWGLVAEDVEKVNPDLVVRDNQGKPYSVRYDQVNAMLLNEFLKEHKAFVEEQHKVQQLEANAARQQKQIEALTTGLQKVSAQLELRKPATQTVLNSQ
jgi:trimeric autotransporter adhesin